MTIEIRNTTEFRDKLAHLITGINELNASGVDPESNFDQELIDAFLYQFAATTPAPATNPAPAKAVGHVIVGTGTWLIPHDFRKLFFVSALEALDYLKLFEKNRPDTKGAYEVKGVYL